MITQIKHYQLIDVNANQHHFEKHSFNSEQDHEGKLNEKFISYDMNNLFHKHSQEYKIKIKKEGEKESAYRSLIQLHQSGNLSITSSYDSKYDTTIITFSGGYSAECSGGGSTGGFDPDTNYRDYKYYNFTTTTTPHTLDQKAASDSVNIWSMPANTVYLIPMCYPRGGTIGNFYFHKGGGLAQKYRIGIYSATSVTNLYPGTLLFDSGDVSTSTFNLNTRAINQAISANTLYWAAFVVSATLNTLRPTVTSYFVCLGTTTGSYSAGNLNWVSHLTSGSFVWGSALPNPFTSLATVVIAGSDRPTMGFSFSA